MIVQIVQYQHNGDDGPAAPLDDATTIDAGAAADVTISEVYRGLIIRTDEGLEFGVCLRDDGVDVVRPDGTFVAVRP